MPSMTTQHDGDIAGDIANDLEPVTPTPLPTQNTEDPAAGRGEDATSTGCGALGHNWTILATMTGPLAVVCDTCTESHWIAGPARDVVIPCVHCEQLIHLLVPTVPDGSARNLLTDPSVDAPSVSSTSVAASANGEDPPPPQEAAPSGVGTPAAGATPHEG